MGKDAVMPAIGCLSRRLYIEDRNRVKKQGGYIEPSSDPCIMCIKRSDCMKSTVTF